jgi:hypothetical protein
MKFDPSEVKIDVSARTISPTKFEMVYTVEISGHDDDPTWMCEQLLSSILGTAKETLQTLFLEGKTPDATNS